MMKNRVFSLCVCLSVAAATSACATTETTLNKVGSYVCTHRELIRATATASLASAQNIKDTTARTIAIDAANVTLIGVESCPPETLPTTTAPAGL